LHATATDTADAPFLTGAVHMLVGPDSIGTGWIETVAPAGMSPRRSLHWIAGRSNREALRRQAGVARTGEVH
jgi:hypothetical protein